jgi:hypothetical protein
MYAVIYRWEAADAIPYASAALRRGGSFCFGVLYPACLPYRLRQAAKRQANSLTLFCGLSLPPLRHKNRKGPGLFRQSEGSYGAVNKVQ